MNRLIPYLNKLPWYLKDYYNDLIHEITVKFKPGDYTDNSKLDPFFLYSYSCQIRDIYDAKKKITDNTEKQNN